MNNGISENLQNFNLKICNFQFWYNFYRKIVVQWFWRFQLNSINSILKNIIRRKELENLNNFSLKIRPLLEIVNVLITILQIFCDSLIQSLTNFRFWERKRFAYFFLGHWRTKKTYRRVAKRSTILHQVPQKHFFLLTL